MAQTLIKNGPGGHISLRVKLRKQGMKTEMTGKEKGKTGKMVGGKKNCVWEISKVRNRELLLWLPDAKSIEFKVKQNDKQGIFIIIQFSVFIKIDFFTVKNR